MTDPAGLAALLTQARRLGRLEVTRGKHARWARAHWTVTLRVDATWTEEGYPMQVTISAEAEDLGAALQEVIAAHEVGL